MRLRENVTYVLLMATLAGDGDRFRDPASFDGLSPLVHTDIVVGRSLLVRSGDADDMWGIPAFEDLRRSYARHRTQVGTTLRYQQ